jgi:hypothetical protein
MLLVQEFLETHTFQDLQKQHGVYASFSKSGHKFSLNYDMIEAKDSDLLASQCRGLVLAAHDGRVLDKSLCPGPTQVLARALDRFFNYGQGSAAPIDWEDPGLSILEKLNGTLCMVYFDPIVNQWCMATRSVPEADLLMDNGLFTFRTLFEKALQETLQMSWTDFTSKLDKSIAYSFELTTPYNQIVVKYLDCRITLIAARDLQLDLEIPLGITTFEWLPRVRSYCLNDIQSVLDWVSTQNPTEHEGVVILDSYFHRVKVKNAQYVAFSKVRDQLGTSERNCMELILAGKDDDVIPFLPEEIVRNLQKIKAGLQVVLRDYDIAYQVATTMVGSNDKKAFALLIGRNKECWPAPLFAMFDGKAKNMKDFIAQNLKNGSWGASFLDKLLDMSKKAVI